LVSPFGTGQLDPALPDDLERAMAADRPRFDADAGVLRARPRSMREPSAGEPGRFRLGIGGTRDGAILVPGNAIGRPAPLILALHGAGGMAAQMLDLLASSAEAYGCIVLAPESRASTWDVIRGGFGLDVEFIDAALDQVFGRHPVDPERIAISGFSDGGSYALSLGVTNGALFRDILAFSPGFMAPTGQADTPRIFISHGVKDEVLPIESCSRRIVPRLESAGYDVEYREFPDGHIVPADMVDAALARFLS
jgi:phospholipase/carboxylesterase